MLAAGLVYLPACAAADKAHSAPTSLTSASVALMDCVSETVYTPDTPCTAAYFTYLAPVQDMTEATELTPSGKEEDTEEKPALHEDSEPTLAAAQGEVCDQVAEGSKLMLVRTCCMLFPAASWLLLFRLLSAAFLLLPGTSAVLLSPAATDASHVTTQASQSTHVHQGTCTPCLFLLQHMSLGCISLEIRQSIDWPRDVHHDTSGLLMTHFQHLSQNLLFCRQTSKQELSPQWLKRVLLRRRGALWSPVRMQLTLLSRRLKSHQSRR